MKAGLYPKIAADGIRKNSRLYLPYIGTCVLMVAIFYIMHLMGYSDGLGNFSGVGTAKDILALGTIIMAVFGTIFLFYTQSTLLKGRKKELGLYNVLGMNRKNIAKILFYENIIIWFISVMAGLLTGIVFSKLAELAFTKLIQVEVNYNFNISVSSVCATFAVYSFIFFLIFINSIRQIRFTRTINLISSDKAGEKPPRANWFLGILGIILLIAGYTISINIKQPLSALTLFFAAVIIIIFGTYLVLISGSVMMCRLLQKNKKYYYKTSHFVSVSSLAFRMKRNGAGLASICILLTMILVMLSSTSALYFNREETLRNQYPSQINLSAHNQGYDEAYDNISAKLKEDVLKQTAEYGAAVKECISYSAYNMTGYYNNNTVDLDINPMEMGLSASIDYDKVVQVFFIDVADYNSLTGNDEKLSQGDILFGYDGDLQFGNELQIGKERYSIAKRIDCRKELKNAFGIPVISTLFVVVDDLNQTAANYKDLADFSGGEMLLWSWNLGFDTDLTPEKQSDLSTKLNTYLRGEIKSLEWDRGNCSSQEAMRYDYLKTFGGLFFLGILLSLIFLVSCVLIIYYKQISEGYEDRSRFEIMQKIGMTKDNIKKSVNSQMLTVFLIPIILAGIHLTTVLPVIDKLLMLFGHNNAYILLSGAGLSFLLCTAIYTVVYKLTSNIYYKIVT